MLPQVIRPAKPLIPRRRVTKICGTLCSELLLLSGELQLQALNLSIYSTECGRI